MHVRWREVCLETWERNNLYQNFRRCEFPYLVVGANVELGNSLEYLKRHQISPYLAKVYLICRAINEVAAFRLRIRGEQVVEHERIHADYTVPLGQEAFTIRLVEYSPEFGLFYPRALAAQDHPEGLVDESQQQDHWVFLSCLPWFSFTHVVQPAGSATTSIPRIIWGRYFRQDDRWKMPISIQAHHGLVDGLHVAWLLGRLEQLLAEPESTFQL